MNKPTSHIQKEYFKVPSCDFNYNTILLSNLTTFLKLTPSQLCHSCADLSTWHGVLYVDISIFTWLPAFTV